MKNSFKPILKKLIFAIIPLLILLIVAEMGARFMYFEKRGKESLALVSAYTNIRLQIIREKASKIVGNLPQGIGEALYSDMGKELLHQFKAEYEENFKLLVEEANNIGSKLAVLYIPSGSMDSASSKDSRQFYTELALKYGVDFIDATDEFLEYPIDVVTLSPENGHLSRFGDKIIVEKISEYIDAYNDYRMSFRFDSRPKLFGDLSPNDDSVWEMKPNMPYHVITNSQGLRMDYDLIFPKEKQRILVLGDSYTFGPYLDNHDTYPVLLDKKYSDKEVINAAKSGYTILDEASLFIERAKYVEPDIVILQVLDNDIYGLFYFKFNQFDRNKKGRQPSKLETEFLNNLKK